MAWAKCHFLTVVSYKLSESLGYDSYIHMDILQHWQTVSAVKCQTPNPWTHSVTLPYLLWSEMSDKVRNQTSNPWIHHTRLSNCKMQYMNRIRPQTPEYILQHCPTISAVRHQTSPWPEPNPLNTPHNAAQAFSAVRHQTWPWPESKPLNTPHNAAQYLVLWNVLRDGAAEEALWELPEPADNCRPHRGIRNPDLCRWLEALNTERGLSDSVVCATAWLVWFLFSCHKSVCRIYA